MSICNDCSFCNTGCVYKDATTLNKYTQCKFRSVVTMEKKASVANATNTVSWPVGDKMRVQVHKDGKIISDEYINP